MGRGGQRTAAKGERTRSLEPSKEGRHTRAVEALAAAAGGTGVRQGQHEGPWAGPAARMKGEVDRAGRRRGSVPKNRPAKGELWAARESSRRDWQAWSGQIYIGHSGVPKGYRRWAITGKYETA